MRVITGKYKGRKLVEFENENTRPTLDRVKESIFDVINFFVEDSLVVDLFAGTGALGIEAISRGAKKVFFVDNNKRALEVINNNVNSLGVDAEIQNVDYLKFLKNLNIKVDIFLLDPPFKTDFAKKAIEFIYENNLLAKDGVIVWEKGFDNSEFHFDFDCKVKKYGTVQVVFLYNKKGNQ